MSTCLDPLDTIEIDDDPQHAFRNCPHLLLAGWRAMVAGDRRRGDALLLRCVNTGAKDYLQWQVARTLLRQRHGDDAFVVESGAHFALRARGDEQLLVVTGIDDGGAARLQGLQPGDVLLRVADAPYDPKTWPDTLSAHRVGHDVLLTLDRAGERRDLMLKLGWRLAPH